MQYMIVGKAVIMYIVFFFFQAEDGIRDADVTGVQTCALPIFDITKIAQQDQLYVLLAGVLGAISWNLITWYFGLPTSSSHALVGAYAGAALAAFSWENSGTANMLSVLEPEGWYKTLAFIVLSPTIGMMLGFMSMVAVYWIFRRVSVRTI